MALVRAYELETKRACYPVIIVNGQDVDRLNKLPGSKDHGWPDRMLRPFKSPFQKQGETFFFVDYLDYIRDPYSHNLTGADPAAWVAEQDSHKRSQLLDKGRIMKAAHFMELHKRRLLEAVRTAPSAKARAKYLWLVKYHNRSLRGYPTAFKSARIKPSRDLPAV